VNSCETWEKYQPAPEVAASGQAHADKGSIKTTADVWWFQIIYVIKTEV